MKTFKDHVGETTKNFSEVELDLVSTVRTIIYNNVEVEPNPHCDCSNTQIISDSAELAAVKIVKLLKSNSVSHIYFSSKYSSNRKK